MGYTLPVRLEGVLNFSSKQVPAADLESALAKAVSAGAKLVPDQSLSSATTLRVGGLPLAWLRCTSPDSVVEAVKQLDRVSQPLLILGGGSNLVVAGGELPIVVVEIVDNGWVLSPAQAAETDHPGRVTASAGMWWDDFVSSTVQAGLSGVECLSGIPGCVGATPVQNVGAYGAEVSSVLHSVEVYNREERQVQRWSVEQLGLAYRHSVLKNTDTAVVLSVTFNLDTSGLSIPLRFGQLCENLQASPGERLGAALVRETVLGLRASKGMVLDRTDHDTWSAGSFFTNPVIPVEKLPDVKEAIVAVCGAQAVESMPAYDAPGGVKLSAAWLIEHAGFPKGFPSPQAHASLSSKHTLALTNRGAATSDDIIALARTVATGVREAFGVDLVSEPVWVLCSIS